MKHLILPRRVFNSPLIRYANFKDGSFVSLIKLIKPYANGNSFALYETTKSPFNHSGLFKTYEKAKEMFDLMVILASCLSELEKQGVTGNSI